jgi:hypothetical protein
MEEKLLLFARGVEEREKWKRTLGFLQQENIMQKNRLAEILRRNAQNNDGNLLETAEQYQSQFLQEDEALRLMWNDLTSLENLIRDEKSKRHDLTEIKRRQDKLRREIESLQKHFHKIKAGFFNFFERSAKKDHPAKLY